MKRFITLLVISSIIFTSCATASAKRKPQKQVVIELDGNPTTGYSWTYTVEGEGIIREVSHEYKAAKKGVTGAGGKFVFVFEGITPGQAILHFAYARSWETDVKPLRTETDTLVVNKQKKILITKKLFQGNMAVNSEK